MKHGFDDKHDQDTSINSVSTGKAVKSFLDQGRFEERKESEIEREKEREREREIEREKER